MNRARLLYLLMATAITVFASVSTASAATPTSPGGTTYEGKLHVTSEGHVTIDNAIINTSCSSTLEGEVKPSGSGGPISIPLSSLTFSDCTNSWHVTVVSPGTLEVHGILGSKNGTATWNGATIEATRFGVTCRYKTEATDIGTLTGSKETGGTATIDLSGKLPLHSGSSFLCGETSNALTGSYKVGTPDYLDVDSEAVPTSPAGTAYKGELHATSEEHVTIETPSFGFQIECVSTLEGEIEAGGPGKPMRVLPGSLSLTGCTSGWHVTVVTPGELEVHSIAGSKNGTVTWTGATITATRSGLTCNFVTSGTDVGTLTGSKTTGGTARLDLSGSLPLHSGSSGLCGSSVWSITGSYKVGTPDYLDVDG